MEHYKKPTLRDILVSSPMGTEANIRVSTVNIRSGPSTIPQITLEEIELHCKSDTCGGIRFFIPSRDNIFPKEKKEEYLFLEYRCKNCEKTSKVYALQFTLIDQQNAKVIKVGEWPPYGSPTPTRLLTILGDEREYYIKGRRAENQGMGIGAFAYYRRVVENQKNSIFDEIIRAAKNTLVPTESINTLLSAKGEGQFTRAVESLKGVLPPALLIDGHNPLTLLHNALSSGLHAQTDEECLVLANSIRIVLTELAERMGEILKDQTELKTAVSRLMTKKTEANKGK